MSTARIALLKPIWTTVTDNMFTAIITVKILIVLATDGCGSWTLDTDSEHIRPFEMKSLGWRTMNRHISYNYTQSTTQLDTYILDKPSRTWHGGSSYSVV